MQGKTVLLELLAIGGIGLLVPWFLLMRTAYQEALSSSETKCLKEYKPLLFLGAIAGLLLVCGFVPFFGWARLWYLAIPGTLVILSVLHWTFTRLSTRTVAPRVRHLQHADLSVRAAAVRTLGQLRDKRAVKPLIRALDDASIRTAAVEALGTVGDASAVERLLPLLEDDKEPTRRSDASSGWRGNARDEAMATRRAAVVALGKIRDARAVNPLIEALGSNDRDLRKSAAAALHALGESAWMQRVTGDCGENGDFARLGACGDPRALRPLSKAVETGNTEAADALAKLGGETVFDTLNAAMKNNPNPYAQVAAAQALGTMRDPRVVPALIDAVNNNDDPQAKAAAVQTLCSIADPRVVPALIDALHGGVAAVRHLAIRALGSLGDPRALEPLRSLLGDADAHARVTATDSLMQLGEGKWKEAVKGDTDDLVRLRSLGHPVTAVPLIAVLKDTSVDPQTACSVAEALGKLRDPEAVDPLIAAFRTTNPVLRRNAAIALGWMGDRRAVEPLLEAMTERNQSSHEYLKEVVSALERLRDERAASALNLYWETRVKSLMKEASDIRVFETPTPAKRELLAIGSRAVGPLIGLLGDRMFSAPWEQSVVAELLGQAGDPRAVVPLRDLLGDDDEGVRRKTAAALGKLGEPQWNAWVKGDRGDFARLGQSGAPEAPDILLKALGAFPFWDRVAAAQALGHLPVGRAIRPLVALLLDDEVGDVKTAAAEALRNLFGRLSQDDIRKAGGFECVIGALGRGSPIAAELLGKLGDPRAVDSLIKALCGTSALRRAAAEALTALGQPEWAQRVQGDDGDFGRLGGSRDPRAVDPLLMAMESGPPRTREAAAEALGQLGGSRTVERLIAAINTEEWRVRKAAAAALIGLVTRTPSMTIPDAPKVFSMIAAPHKDEHEDHSLGTYDYRSSDCHGDHADNHGDAGIGVEVPAGLPGTEF